MQKRNQFWAAFSFLWAFVFWVGKDMLASMFGDILIELLPDSVKNDVSQDVILYLPAVLFFVLGVMAIKGWGANTTIHLSKPHFRREPAAIQERKPAISDHWTERKQLEIYVLANVSVGRDSADTEIKKEPELSRLRELKDAITLGELDATINGERPNVWSTVSLKSLEQYVAATNKPYWIEILHRWQTTQNRANTAPVPDWRIGEAMDHVAIELGSEDEQDVDTKYSEPAGMITSKALSGEIKVWGKRLIAENKPELTQREIGSSEWNERELLIWACQPYTRKAQTQSVGQHKTQQLTDLYVNESQIKEIRWRDENTYGPSEQPDHRYDTPIHEAVEYVARRIDDYDSDKCYPSARREIRKAAFDGNIKMHGKRELKEGHHSDLTSPIPQDFWDDQELNALATSVVETHKDHTQAEMAPGFKTISERKEKYWDVRIRMDEVKRFWP